MENQFNNIPQNSVTNLGSTQNSPAQPVSESHNTTTTEHTTIQEQPKITYEQSNLSQQQIQQPVYNNIQQPQTVQSVVQQQVNEQAQAQVVQQTTTAQQPITPVHNAGNTTQSTVTNPQYQWQPQVAPQQPVTANPTPINTTAQQPVINTQQPQPQVNNIPQQQSTAAKPEPVKQSIESDKFIIKTEDLKEMVKNACLLTKNVDGLLVTQVVQLVFSREGFIIKSTDKTNVLVQKNTSIKYNEDLSIAIKADLFEKLVNKLVTEYVEILFDSETRVITLITGESKYQFAESYDAVDGQNINIEDNFYNESEQFITFDGNTFKERINQVSSFTSSKDVEAVISGVYCADRIYATNRNDIAVVANDPKLVNETFYLMDKYTNILTQLSFVGETQIGFNKDETGKITSLTIKDDTKMLSGPTNPDVALFPVSTLQKLINIDLGNEFEIDANQLFSILDTAKLFINAIEDKEVIEVQVQDETKTLVIKTKNGSSVSRFTLKPVDPTKVKLINHSFGLFITNTLEVLKNIDRSKVTISIGCLTSDNSFIIVRSQGAVILTSMKNLN